MIFKIKNFLTLDECRVIYDRILETEDHVKSLGQDLHNGTSENSLTGRHWCHNYLYDSIIGKILIPKVTIIFGHNRYVQCWANTFRNGEGIKNHIHRNPNNPHAPMRDWTCTNLFIGGNSNVGTWFDGEKHDNNVGELMIFSSSLPHFVPENDSDEIRITMAMDIHYKKISNSTKQYYQL